MALKRIITQTSLILSLIISLIFLNQYGIADYYEYDYFYTSDNLSREHRLAGDVDDWIERGNSMVTASPIFEDGIRLTAWGSKYQTDESFEFGIASAVYFFEIPKGTQSLEIKVRYKGEPHEGYLDEYGKVAGRLWIRNIEKEREYQFEDGDTDTLYGDTFVLRANRRSETIKIAAADHVNDGLLELHIVAQAGELIDVDYIDVLAKMRRPEVRVVHRYVKEYEWDPWYNYTYCYFYLGPHYHLTNHDYYVRWSYPIYDRHYILIRTNYRRYLDIYRRRHGIFVHYYYRPVRNERIRVFYNRNNARSLNRLAKWTERHETVRNEYSRSLYTNKKRRKASEFRDTQNHVRQVIEKHRREPVLIDREINSRRVTLKRRRDNISRDDRIDESSRSSMKTRIFPRYRNTDEQKKTTREINTKFNNQRTRVKIRRESEPSNERKVEIKHRRTEIKKSRDREKEEDDDDEEEEERIKNRNSRKKRR